MILAAYSRVSTKEQLDGFGLDVQSSSMEGWASARDISLLAFCDAGESGSNGVETRRGLHAAMACVASGDASGLLVPRLDRLARDLILQEVLIAEVRRCGGEVYSCVPSEDALLRDDASDPGRKMIRQIMGAVAEYERAVIRLRLEAGIARKKASGGYAGGRPPYGSSAVNGELVAIPAEAEVISFIEGLRDEGLSYSSIASRLNAAGHLRRGRPWHQEQVRRVLSRLP